MNSSFALIGFQRTTHVASNLARSKLLDPEREFHDGSLKGKLVLIDFEESGREQV